MDRWDRKRVMMLCEPGARAQPGQRADGAGLGVLTVWQLYVNAFIEGTLFVFFNIAEVPPLPRVVGKEQLPDARRRTRPPFGLAGLIAPPSAASSTRPSGGWCRLCSTRCPMASRSSRCFMIRTAFQGSAPRQQRNLRAEIGEGLRWLWSSR